MLNKENSLLLMIDFQEKLVSMLKEKSEIASKKAQILVSAAQKLNIKTILTEQYPKGLGGTIEDIKNILKDDYKPHEKTSFSAIKEDEILNEIEKSGKKQIIVFGIEAHICVFQTAVELKEKGYEVFVVCDASYSRNESEKELALKNLRHLGILTLSVESVLFMWLESSKNPDFREIQALIK